MFLKNMYMMSMSSLLTPLFCSISDESLFFFQIHTLSLVCDRGDGGASLLLFFISQGPRRPQGDRTAVLHASEAKKCCVSIDPASPLTISLSPVTGWYLYFCSILLSQ